MKKRLVWIGAGLVVAALAVATWASPHWQLYRMYDAVEARDAAALSAYVDFPKLRASVKQELTRRLGPKGPLAEAGSNPFAAFGRSMALAVIDPIVDAAVSPAGVVAMLESGDIRVQPERQDIPGPSDEGGREEINYALSYRGWGQAVVERADGSGVAFVLDRHGLWGWKLAGVELREDR